VVGISCSFQISAAGTPFLSVKAPPRPANIRGFPTKAAEGAVKM